MHFFNPAPVMKLVEVIAGIDSSEEALAVARATGEAMGKRVIDATDGPGFLVNRCNRPFGLEALKLLADGVAEVEQIDEIVRGNGFRMGPFELQDLVGIDTGYEVSLSFHELSFGEPRWRPSPLSARMVAAKRFGRKTDRGWYDYPRERPTTRRSASPAAATGASSSSPARCRWPTSCARWPRRPASTPAPRTTPAARCRGCWSTAAPTPRASRSRAGRSRCCWPTARCTPSTAAAARSGFHVLPPLDAAAVVELTRDEATADVAADRAEELFRALGRRTVWVGDAPGLVMGRIAAQLVNEAAFAVAEGVGSPDDVDEGMVLGMSHPRGPFAWAADIDPVHVVAILDAPAPRARRGALPHRAAAAAPHTSGH